LVAGIGPVHGGDESDLVLRNKSTGAFEVYDIAGNTPCRRSLNLSAVQTMAGFGGDAADTSATAPLSADTTQETFLTTPHA
jgi:phage-related baseplate assembly protein